MVEFMYLNILCKEKYSYYLDKTHAYIMPDERSMNIDTKNDFFKIAEFLMVKIFKYEISLHNKVL